MSRSPPSAPTGRPSPEGVPLAALGNGPRGREGGEMKAQGMKVLGELADLCAAVVMRLDIERDGAQARGHSGYIMGACHADLRATLTEARAVLSDQA